MTNNHIWRVADDYDLVSHARRDDVYCPVCKEATASFLPTRWTTLDRTYEAYFCEKHSPDDLLAVDPPGCDMCWMTREEHERDLAHWAKLEKLREKRK